MFNSKYRHELTRLQSFKYWPKPDIISPKKLATAGFYYTGTYDRTECFECGIPIYSWEIEDDPWYEHQRWGGCCKFIRGISSNNLPLVSSVNEVALRTRREPSQILRDIERNYGKDVTGIFKTEKKFSDIDSRLICKICLEREIKTLFLPCRHILACRECAEKIEYCCVCRKTIAWKLDVYLA